MPKLLVLCCALGICKLAVLLESLTLSSLGIRLRYLSCCCRCIAYAPSSSPKLLQAVAASFFGALAEQDSSKLG